MKLNDYKKREPFKVPEGYFENLADNIMQKLPREEASVHTTSRNTTLATRLRRIGYAASIAVILFLGSIAITQTSNKSTTIATSSDELYSNEYIDDLLENYTFDDYTFYCYLTENN